MNSKIIYKIFYAIKNFSFSDLKPLFLIALFSSICVIFAYSNLMAFPNIPDDSWYEVQPSYPHLMTSQSSIGYDQDRNEFVFWGGHPTHGGYPQIYETFVYNIETERFRVDRPVNMSPPNICVTNDALFDEAREVFVAFEQSEAGSHDWHRNIRHLKGIKAYDIEAKKWYFLRPQPSFLNSSYYMSPPYGAAYDSFNQVIFMLFHSSQGTWLYDPYTNYWESVRAWNQSPTLGYDWGMVYDRTEKKIVAFGPSNNTKTWVYDVSNNTWTQKFPSTHPPFATTKDAPPDGSNSGGVYGMKGCYDTINEKVLYFINRWHEDRIESWAYDTRMNTWTKKASSPSSLGSRGGDTVATFLPDYNTAVVTDFNRPGYTGSNKRRFWYYRYAAGSGPTPKPPTDPAITVNSNSVVLNWTAASGVAGYKVYRGSGTNGKSWQVTNYTQVSGASPVTSTTWTDNSVSSDTIYYYYITSVDSGGNESSESEMVRTQPMPPWEMVVSVKSTSQVKVSWTPNPRITSSNIKGYNIYRSTVTPSVYTLNYTYPDPEDEPIYTRKTIKEISSFGNWSKLNGSLITGTTTYTDNTANLSSNSSAYGRNVYAYRITAVDNLNMESGYSPYYITIPQPVKHLNWGEAWGSNSGIINLEWTASGEENLQGYRVWRLSAGGGANTELTTNPQAGLTYQDTVSGSEGSNKDMAYFVTATDVLGQDGWPSSQAAVNRNEKYIWDNFHYLDDYYVGPPRVSAPQNLQIVSPQ